MSSMPPERWTRQSPWLRGERLSIRSRFTIALRRMRAVRLHAPGTPDSVFLAGDRVYVVTQLFDALVASLGTGGEGEVMEEIEPIEIVANRVKGETAAAEG